MDVTEEDRERVSVYEQTGDVEKEERLVKKWKRKAKGKQNRWRMLRDCVACLSLAWMDTSEIQIAMMRLYALKFKTTRDMLEELENGRAIRQEKTYDGDRFKWGATTEGVFFWIGKEGVKLIPASIAQVVQITTSVNGSEE